MVNNSGYNYYLLFIFSNIGLFLWYICVDVINNINIRYTNNYIIILCKDLLHKNYIYI
jgi:hypothetical protein